MGRPRIIHCKIIRKEPENPTEYASSSIVIKGPSTIYVGVSDEGKGVLIKEDASNPLNFKTGEHIEIERTRFLGIFPKDRVIYPDGRKKQIYVWRI